MTNPAMWLNNNPSGTFSFPFSFKNDVQEIIVKKHAGSFDNARVLYEQKPRFLLVLCSKGDKFLLLDSDFITHDLGHGATEHLTHQAGIHRADIGSTIGLLVNGDRAGHHD